MSSYLAFSPLPQTLARSLGRIFSVTLSVAVPFRKRCPRLLRGMLPSGVRTFLWPALRPASDHLPSLGQYHTREGGKAGFWGAHAPRVLAMAPRHRELSLPPCAPPQKPVSARAPKPAREARALPREQPVALLTFNLEEKPPMPRSDSLGQQPVRQESRCIPSWPRCKTRPAGFRSSPALRDDRSRPRAARQ